MHAYSPGGRSQQAAKAALLSKASWSEMCLHSLRGQWPTYLGCASGRKWLHTAHAPPALRPSACAACLREIAALSRRPHIDSGIVPYISLACSDTTVLRMRHRHGTAVLRVWQLPIISRNSRWVVRPGLRGKDAQ